MLGGGGAAGQGRCLAEKWWGRGGKVKKRRIQRNDQNRQRITIST